MGNSESNTPKIGSKNTPLKPTIKKIRFPDTVDQYHYYPAQYIPEQYAYPTYPENYPVISNENYRQNKVYPQMETNDELPKQPILTYDNDNNRSYHDYYHDQYSPYDHYYYDYHQHPSALPSEKQPFNTPVLTERTTAPPPPLPLPSVQAQIPVSSAVTYKSTSPVDNKELKSSSPVHKAPSIIVKKPATPILPKKSSSIVVVNQHQSLQPGGISSFSVRSNHSEKAPIIEINYPTRSSSSHSIHSYGPGTMSTLGQNSPQCPTPGNRWYDHNYDKRIKTLTIIDI